MKTIGNLTKDAIVKAVASEGFTVSSSVGSGTVFESAGTGSTAIGYDTSNDKVVIAYQDQGNSNYGTAIVGTVSGTSISFGTAVVYESANIHSQCIVFDSSNNKVVIIYADAGNSDHGTAVVGTVSGTSISFGTPVVFHAGGTSMISAAFDTTANKIVIAYRVSSGKAIVGTVSGTSISFGSEAEFESGETYNTATAYDTNANKTVVAYRDNGNSDYGKAAVGTVSGTSISFGTPVNFDTQNSRDIMASYDPVNQKVLIVYKVLSSPNPGYAIVGTVSGTSISFGTRVEYHAGSTDVNRVVYDANAAKHVILYRDHDPSPNHGRIKEATISGTSVSYSDEFTWSTTNFSEPVITYDPDQKKAVFAYVDANNSSYGTSRVYTTSLTSATGGTIADGASVIVNANGTVSGVTQSSVAAVTGTKSIFEPNQADYTRIAYDPVNNKMFIAYVDAGDSSKGKCVVATISGTSITYGSLFTFHNNSTNFVDTIYDTASGKFVIVYYDGDNSGYGTSVVATVDGTNITFGSDVIFVSEAMGYTSLIYSTAAQKVVVSYRGTSDVGKSQVGTVSGTSISWGSQYDYNSGATGPAVHSAYDVANDRLVVVYKDSDNSNRGTARVGSISGSAITWGSETVFNTGSSDNVSSVYDASTEKILIVYRDAGNSNYATAIVGTVSGTAITFGSEAVLASVNATNFNILHHPDANYNVIIYRDNTNSNLIKFATATISGTSVTFGTVTTLNSEQGYYMDQAWDLVNKKIMVVYRASSNSNFGTGVVYTPEHNASNLTSENFIGIMNGPTLDTTSGEVLTSCNVARNLTSLTPGQTYFVSPTNGALSLTAGSPSVTAGTAISSTELIVKG